MASTVRAVPAELETRPFVSVLAFAGIASLVFLAGAIGSVATSSSVETWYETLRKPAWTPPGSVIGAVWSVLYVLMATAAWLVWRRAGARPEGRLALGLFGLQLVLNALWSIVFFGARAPGWAVLEIIALAFAIVATIAAFWRVSRPAALLLGPYLAWVLFAGFLNIRIWMMN